MKIAAESNGRLGIYGRECWICFFVSFFLEDNANVPRIVAQSKVWAGGSMHQVGFDRLRIVGEGIRYAAGARVLGDISIFSPA